MLKAVLNWRRADSGAGQGRRQILTSHFEPLEPRLLLNADLPDIQPPLACGDSCPEQAVYVALHREGAGSGEGNSGVSVTLPAASPDPTGPAAGGGNSVLETAAGPVEAASLEGGTAAGIRGLSAAGEPDPTFGTDIVTTPLGPSDDVGRSVALQADGKIVVAGSSFNGSNDDFAVVRYNRDGSLDVSFNGTGKVRTPIGPSDDIGYGVALQSDGKIVVAGSSFNGRNDDFAVVRYNPDGSLDASFNGTGKVRTPIGPSDDVGRSVALQADGRIVVAGFSADGSSRDFAVVCYNPDGSLDPSFDLDGKVRTSIGPSDDVGYSVALQADGRIVVAGSSFNGRNDDFAAVRYNPDGSLDPSFDLDGEVRTPIGPSDDVGYSVALQVDGKIVVAGVSADGSRKDFAVVRYNPDGSLDTSFDLDGKVTTSIGPSDAVGHSVALQSDGKIVVAGFSNNGGGKDFALVRYNSDGLLDTSFGNATGNVTTPIGASFNIGYSVAIQSDGKIVVAGDSGDGTDHHFALVRYQAFPTPSGLSPVFRFWKPSDNTHFYTIQQGEKQKLLDHYAHIYTYEGVACYAFTVGQQAADTLPVYRFWKPSDNTHFYTSQAGEKQKLLDHYAHIYTYEGVAYYAYGIAQHPLGTLPVYRFWKPSDNTHFYTMSESEKDKLILFFSSIFTFENAVWYAHAL